MTGQERLRSRRAADTARRPAAHFASGRGLAAQLPRMRRFAFVTMATFLTLAACGARTEIDFASGGSLGDAGATPDGAPTLDASVDTSAPLDSPSDLVAPRAVSPLSTSRVTSRRPTLRWVLPAGVTDATIDLCLDRACTAPIGTAHVTGSSYAPPTDLPVGVVFWRLHPSTATSVTSPTWQFTVGARSAPLDSSWGTTLDVNGDGYADLVVGAPQVEDAGAAYVYLGSGTGLAAAAATTLIGPDGSYAEFGWSVASAGDVNGDGFADLAVATRGDGPACVHVYVGGVAGLATTPVTTICLTGSGLSEDVSIASAGDVNGDGYADLVVGGGATGGASVYLGSSAGLGTTPSTTLTGTYDATVPTAFVGVGSAGDVNGDGFGDVIVAAMDGAWGATGGVYVYLGSATGLSTAPASTFPGAFPVGGGFEFDLSVASAGDVNGDGYGDVFVGACDSVGCGHVYLGSASGLGASPATTLSPAGPTGEVGGVSAGDVNGDGYGDVVVGGQQSNGQQFVFVYLGGAGGLATTPATTPTQPPSRVVGNAGSGFGSSFASAGDVNGDGFADLVVGEDYGIPGLEPDDTGSAYIYVGSVTGLAATPTTSLTGVAGKHGRFGASVFGASD